MRDKFVYPNHCDDYDYDIATIDDVAYFDTVYAFKLNSEYKGKILDLRDSSALTSLKCPELLKILINDKDYTMYHVALVCAASYAAMKMFCELSKSGYIAPITNNGNYNEFKFRPETFDFETKHLDKNSCFKAIECFASEKPLNRKLKNFMEFDRKHTVFLIRNAIKAIQKANSSLSLKDIFEEFWSTYEWMYKNHLPPKIIRDCAEFLANHYTVRPYLSNNNETLAHTRPFAYALQSLIVKDGNYAGLIENDYYSDKSRASESGQALAVFDSKLISEVTINPMSQNLLTKLKNIEGRITVKQFDDANKKENR